MAMVIISIVTLLLLGMIYYSKLGHSGKIAPYHHRNPTGKKHNIKKLIRQYAELKSVEDKVEFLNVFSEPLSFKFESCLYLTEHFSTEDDAVKAMIIRIIKQSFNQEQFIKHIQPIIPSLDEKIKFQLITLLEVMIIPEVKELLLSFAKDKGSAIRERSVFGLKKFLNSDPAVNETFIEFLKDPNPNIRINSIKGSIGVKDDEFLRTASAMYSGESQEVKSVLLEYFKQCKDFCAFQMIMDSYLQLPPDDRAIARDVLLESENMAHLEFVQSELSKVDIQLRDDAVKIVEKGLVKAGFNKESIRRKVDEIQNSFSDADQDFQASLPALKKISLDSESRTYINQIADTDDLDELKKFIRENAGDSKKINFLVTRVLDQNDPRRTSTLVDCFESLPQQSQYGVIMKIGQKNWREFCSFLKSTSTEGNSFLIRSACINSLSTIDIDYVFNTMLDYLNDTSPGVLFTAASNLHRHFRNGFIELLTELLKEENNVRVKLNILKIIERFSLDVDEKLLIEQYGIDDSDMRAAVIDIFLKKGKFSHIDMIIDSFNQKDSDLGGLWKRISKMNLKRGKVSKSVFLSNDEQKLYATLVRFDQEDIRQNLRNIEQLKTHPSSHIKALVIKKLWSHYGEELDLSQFFEETSDIVKGEIISIIRRDKVYRYKNYLLSLISPKLNPPVLADVIETLEVLKVKEAIPLLKSIQKKVPKNLSVKIAKVVSVLDALPKHK